MIGNKISNDRDLHILINRINKSVVKFCPICLEDEHKCIDFECTHDSCINCHLQKKDVPNIL